MNHYLIIRGFECRLENMDKKLDNIQNRLSELLEKVEACGIDTVVCGTTFTHWDNETRAKYGLPLKESEDEE